jgi:glycogenin
VAKVGAIFPWEQRSRPAPKRVFPDWDPKPPGLKSPPRTNIAEIEEALIATAATGHIEPPPPGRRSPSPPPHIQRKFNPPPSPPLRQGSIYVNAWDTDFGIQRYASKLQGRSSPFSPQPWPSHPGQEAHASKTKKAPGVQEEEEEEYTNWNEKAEASSRDGDDEDDEDDEAILSPKSSARRRAAKAKGNSYRHQGVQTDPKVTYSRGVQVSSFSAYKRPTEWEAPSHRNSYASNGYLDEPKENIEQQTYGVTRQEKPLLPAFEEELADPAFRPSTALHDAEERSKAGGEIGSPMAPVLRKRDSSEDSVTTAAESSIISSPTKEVEEVGTPRVRILLPEQAEVSAVSGRAPGGRRGGRVFSPTTGVDIFKRGSEEVLARFLMQDPAVWGGNRQTSQSPPTPSTIH